MRRVLFSLLLILLMPGLVFAAVAIDASSHGGAQSTSATWNHTATGSNLEMICTVTLYRGGTETVSSVTYNGVGLSLISGAINHNGDVEGEMWHLDSPATGTNSVVVTASGSTDIVGSCTTFTGVDVGGTPLGTAANAFGTSTTPSVTATSAAGELVVGGLSVNSASGSGATAGSGETQIDLGSQNGSHLNVVEAVSYSEAGAASVTIAPTLNNSWNWILSAVSLKPAAGGGPDTTTFYKRRIQ